MTKVEIGTVTGTTLIDLNAMTVAQATEMTYDADGFRLADKLTGGGSSRALTQYSYDSEHRLQCAAQRLNPAEWGSLPSDACTLGTAGSFGPDRITKNHYDLAGQLTKVTEALGTADEADEATYAHTLGGKREFLTDARNFKARFVYDGHDRQVEWRFPDKVATNTVSATDKEAYQLDLNGNRTRLTKRDGQVIDYSYDLLNRMTVKDLPGTAQDVAYAYNNLGAQLSALFSASGQGVTSVYDPLGRLTSSTNSMGGTSRTLAYQYDLAGRRTHVTHPDGSSFRYDYDTAARLTEITENSGPGLAGFAYDTPGRLSLIDRANPWDSYYEYDPVSRLSALIHTRYSAPEDVRFELAYNPASQIRTRWASADAYAFTNLPAGSKAYSVNGLNQYTAVAGTAHTHDANGNLTSDGATTYAYDAENRLVSASGARTATLTYDPLGRLFETSGSGGPGLRRFLYDGDELVAEYDSAGALVKRYVHGAAVDDPVVEYNGAGLADRRFLHADHQGSIIAITDMAGAATVNRYDEYGVPQATNTGRFGYTGQIWIPELGLWHYKARAYNPWLGRFHQTDPVTYDHLVNLYPYVGNDPMNAIDPSGGACIGINGLSNYCRRAELYRRFDAKFASQTRFFAAASMTTTYLANLSIPGVADLTVGGQTRAFLSGVSTGLEGLNVQMAKALESGRISGTNLDSALVHIEQSAVQNALNGLRGRNPALYSAVLREVNGLLNARGGLRAAGGAYPSDRAYQRVLDDVRKGLGRNIDFSRQSDREAIGNALAEEVRDVASCTETGSRIPRCE